MKELDWLRALVTSWPEEPTPVDLKEALKTPDGTTRVGDRPYVNAWCFGPSGVYNGQFTAKGVIPTSLPIGAVQYRNPKPYSTKMDALRAWRRYVLIVAGKRLAKIDELIMDEFKEQTNVSA